MRSPVPPAPPVVALSAVLPRRSIPPSRTARARCGFVQDAEGTVASINQGTCFLDEVPEEDRKFDISLDHEDGVHQAAELGRTVDTSIRHPRDRSPWQGGRRTAVKTGGRARGSSLS